MSVLGKVKKLWSTSCGTALPGSAAGEDPPYPVPLCVALGQRARNHVACFLKIRSLLNGVIKGPETTSNLSLLLRSATCIIIVALNLSTMPKVEWWSGLTGPAGTTRTADSGGPVVVSLLLRNCEDNVSCTLPGREQSNQRAELFAAILALDKFGGRLKCDRTPPTW